MANMRRGMGSRPQITFSACIVGETTLPIQCAEILLGAGHQVLAIASTEAEVVDWAQANRVPCFGAVADLKAHLTGARLDYLFSINNLMVLPTALVTLPKQASVNFHDGPLPRYAGLNAPSWALINQETDFAITWHVMSDRVDAGDILLQRAVPITNLDTALSLNAKCYQAAVESFADLVDGLASRTITPLAQDLHRRTYFGQDARPPAGGVLRWDRPAEELSALVRALDFGDYRHPFGLPKVATAAGLIAVGGASVQAPSGLPPGTVTAVDDSTVSVATATGDLSVSRLRLPERNGLAIGTRLPLLTDGEAERLDKRDRDLARVEAFWTRRWADAELLDVVDLAGKSAGDVNRDMTSCHLVLPFTGGSADRTLAAVAFYLGRIAARQVYDVGLQEPARDDADVLPLEASYRLLHVVVDPEAPFGVNLNSFARELSEIRGRLPHARDLLARDPQLRRGHEPRVILAVEVSATAVIETADLTISVSADGRSTAWFYRPGAICAADVQRLQHQLIAFVSDLVEHSEVPVGELNVVDPGSQALLARLNDTATEYDAHTSVLDQLDLQADQTPDRVALVADGVELTYGQLHARANQLARRLQKLGVGVERRVGVCLERSTDLVVALLAVLKASGSYVPLDPRYPAKRIAFMVEDAGMAAVITTTSIAEQLLPEGMPTVKVDADVATIDAESAASVRSNVDPENLAYMIYTSGSTGRPKGVMVTHRNLFNFFIGMDERVQHDPPGTWLAVTSISFDISVLELLWTLARGFKVVLLTGHERPVTIAPNHIASARRTMDFSVSYFGSSDRSPTGAYRLVLEGARFADENDFAAVWTPERHFDAFGGLYPNPSVLGAAIAAITRRVGIRAGSCVAPLHDPIRIAEEWSVVDNLSGGRVGISFAPGWQPDDFTLAPGNFETRRQVMADSIEVVRRLWRGEAITRSGPGGRQVEVRILPRPLQSELPVWITSAGTPATFRMAGERGFKLLTHLLGQSVEELAEKIEIYREAWRAGGHAADGGHVTVMLHTFVGDDDDVVREQVRAPMKRYLRSSVGLIRKAAWKFPAFKRETTDPSGRFAMDHLPAEEMDRVLDFSFERYFETSGLLGSPQKGLDLVRRLWEIGVSEIACLIDFHDSTEAVIEHLPALARLRAQAAGRIHHVISEPVRMDPVAALIEQHRVTHLQCTPSMATLLLGDADCRRALGSLRQVLIGGEPFTPRLARELRRVVSGTILNMYGPTETTVWSSSFEVDAVGGESNADAMPIGKPLANTSFHVLDARLQPVPMGTIGELYIGGDGVARGYHNRSELTAERFIPDTFSARQGARLYRTGDLASYDADGAFHFIGRRDTQVKVRGYRIELGEIENALSLHPAVQEVAVVARPDRSEGRQLAAYVVARAGQSLDPSELRLHLVERLPDYMVPARFQLLDQLPRTPNGKVDRNALPEHSERQLSLPGSAGSPTSDTERRLVAIWERELGVRPIGIHENFFELGGHSLLALRVFHQIERAFGKRLPLSTLFDAPTVARLAKSVVRWESPTATAMVKIQAGGDRLPFFCLHAHGGHVLLYSELARQLGPDQPFFGIQAIGLDGAAEPYRTVPQMAGHYVDEIKQVQPTGPYLIGGDCLGGAIAYEVARQLKEEGHHIALLAMFDAYCPGRPTLRSWMPAPLYRWLHGMRILGFHARTILEGPNGGRAAYVGERLQRAAFEIRGRLGRLVDRPTPLILTQMALEDAYDAYEPRPFEGQVTLFRARNLPIGASERPEAAWGALANAGVDVHLLPGYFMTSMSGANVAILARELRACIDERLQSLGSGHNPSANGAQPAQSKTLTVQEPAGAATAAM